MQVESVASAGGRQILKGLLFLLLVSAFPPASASRTCFVSLRLSTSKGPITKDIPNFKVRAFPWATCRTATRECPVRLFSHVQAVLGKELIPIQGAANKKLCDIFKMQLTPSDNAQLYATVNPSNCGGKFDPEHLGKLCCWKFTLGPYTIMHPNYNCKSTSPPDW